MDNRLLIGQVAKEVGLSAKLIRYYEKVGLISPPARGQSGHTSLGYRLFTQDDIRRLEFIKRARLLDLPRADIRELLTEHANGCCGTTRPNLRVLLEVKRREMDEKISELQLLRDDLELLYQDLTPTSPNPREEAECRSGASACECLFGIVPYTSIETMAGR